MEERRQERVAKLLREELGKLLLQKVKDPTVAGVTITAVHVSPDFSIAQIFFAASDDESAKRIGGGLDRASPFLRRQLKSNLRLKRTPELRFKRDLNLEHGSHIDAILREISTEEGEG